MRPKTIPELQQAIELRAAGYTLASIVERTDISASTLQRHFKANKVGRGTLSSESIERAREQLLNDAGFIDNLKNQIAASIVDDLSLCKLIREQLVITLEQLATETPSMKARALAAISTSAALTQKLSRTALRVDAGALDEVEELPTLTVTQMTEEEIEAVRSRFDDDEEFEVRSRFDDDEFE